MINTDIMAKLLVTANVLVAILAISGCYATEYFDLGFPLDETTLFYPGYPNSEFLLKHDVEGFNFTVPDHIRYWFAQYSFSMNEHGGTHVDGPFHFNDKGWKVGEIPLDRLVGVKATIVDVEKDVFALNDPSSLKVNVGHILEHERKYGRIPLGSVVILHTGWAERYYFDKEKYIGEKNGTLNFPGLSGEAAKWLVDERKVVGVGIDALSVEFGNAGGDPIAHRILCGNQVYIIENVANLNVLLKAIQPVEGYDVQSTPSASSTAYAGDIGASAAVGQCDLRLIVLPVKTKGTGGPARVLAYCN